MIEKYIGGREIQVAILGKRKLGAIELKPKRKFLIKQSITLSLKQTFDTS